MSKPHSALLFGVLGVQKGYLQAEDLAQVLRDCPELADAELGNVLAEYKLLTPEQKQELDELVRVYPTSEVPATVDGAAAKTARASSASQGKQSRERGTTESGGDQSVQARFVTLRPLAQGGLGKVSIALDRELEREVAVKEILRDAQAQPEQLERFVAEAKITGGLEHPGIVPVYGLEHSTAGRPRYAMRLIRGQSLQDLINAFFAKPGNRTLQTSSAEFRRLVRALMDACNALAYAHSRGVVHRDIKPSNIMLGKFGETLVVDWGLAKVVDQE